MRHITFRTGLTLAAATVLAASVATTAVAADAELTIFDWSGYEAPEFHPKYAEKHGDSPSFTFFGDEDEAFEKMRAGFKVDLAHPCSQSVVKWREAGLLEPLDTSKIEGWKDLNPGIMAMKNLATDGAHYWVLAHITPSIDASGRPCGYHSNRRAPTWAGIPAVEEVYRHVLAAERGLGAREAALAGDAALDRLLAERGLTYEAWVWSLEREEAA